MVIESGRVRYTKHGYRCRKCGFGFKWELTSPVSHCPNCGDIINDRMAYLICRAGRAFGMAFTIMLIPFVLELIYVPKTWPLISIIPLALLTVILYYKQIWSLIAMRILYRALLITAIVLLILVLIAGALSALKIYPYNGTAVVAISLIISLLLTIVSLIALKVNGNTYDYHGGGLNSICNEPEGSRIQ